jgi:thiol-disulfide isomerase/thioredoxin
MASKRRRKQLLKQDRDLEQRMGHRREAFNDLARKVGVVALAILLVASGVWYFFLYEPGPERPEPWRLEDTEGNWHDSDDYYKSGVTLVEFFHSKCPHCNEQAPDLNNLHIDYRENLSGFFSIGGFKLGSNRDDMQDIYDFREAHGSGWPHLYNINGELMGDQGFSNYPSFILVKDGYIVWKQSGRLSYNELAAVLEQHGVHSKFE